MGVGTFLGFIGTNGLQKTYIGKEIPFLNHQKYDKNIFKQIFTMINVYICHFPDLTKRYYTPNDVSCIIKYGILP